MHVDAVPTWVFHSHTGNGDKKSMADAREVAMVDVSERRSCDVYSVCLYAFAKKEEDVGFLLAHRKW
jgi:hypothetical protein